MNWKNLQVFWSILGVGLINNSGYCVVASASQDLSVVFHTENLLTAFLLVIQIACILTTVLNGGILMKYTPHTRIVLVLIMSSLSYGLLSLSTTQPNVLGFSIALLASVLAGAAQSIGECTMLAFLSCFPQKMLGGWGAGTGIAGLVGPGYYMLLHSSKVSSYIIFLCVIPTCFLYYMMFRFLEKSKPRSDSLSIPIMAKELVSEQSINNTAADSDWKLGLSNRFADPVMTDDECLAEEAMGPRTISRGIPMKQLPMNCGTIKLVFRHAGLIILNMIGVYFFEYSIYPGLVDRDTKFVQKGHFIQENAYILSWMAYNIGVSISRASVSFFTIKKVHFLTITQGLFSIGWLIEAHTHTIKNMGDDGTYLMLVWMVFVGLMGGGTYVNCMALMNRSPEIPDNLRELGVNITFTLLNFGVMFANVLFLLLDNTVLRLEVLYPAQYFPNGTLICEDTTYACQPWYSD